MTWRASEELLERVRRQAAEQGRSLNEWVTLVLDAASDPPTAGGPAQQLRERLGRAGLLEVQDMTVPADPSHPAPARPSPERLATARAAAGSGTTLAQLVADGRG